MNKNLSICVSLLILTTLSTSAKVTKTMPRNTNNSNHQRIINLLINGPVQPARQTRPNNPATNWRPTFNGRTMQPGESIIIGDGPFANNNR